MKILAVTVLTVCLHAKLAVATPDPVNIANRTIVSASSTLEYEGFNYNPQNVIDGNNQTSPEICNCCWSSKNETSPALTLHLPQKHLISSLEIIGRSDQLDSVPRILTGVNIAVDGVDMTHDQRLVGNTTIRLDITQSVSNITVTRPRPTGQTEWYLVICEINLYSQGVDIIHSLAKNIQVDQSSVYINDVPYFGPHNAIDGHGTVDIHNCPCCSVTNNAGSVSWWQIDLGQHYFVQAIQVFGRAVDANSDYNEQLQGAVVYAGNTSLTQDQHQGVTIYTVPTMNRTTRHFTQILKVAITSQYFLVELSTSVLSLCEFKVFQTVCDVGSFDLRCNQMCHCYDNKSCDVVTGECQSKQCYPGWLGSACDQECTPPGFGTDCGSTCHCINGTQCDHVTGHCDIGQCDPGWQGDSCSKVCDFGTFGVNCTQNCHCHDNQTCNSVTGECQTPGCAPGWRGAACDQECLTPTFGADCGSTCHCINGTHCDHVTGHCDVGQCDPGWQGDSCSEECVFPTFGNNCGNTCRCIDDTHCDHVTGHCDRKQCNPGWKGESCSEECVSPSFGSQCSKECHCINGTHCGHVSGHCDLKQCDPGWYGQSCDQECVVDLYHLNCTPICHCYDNKTCNNVTDECQTPGCYPGWNGTACDRECVSPAFGKDCDSTCHCMNGTNCDSVTGHCDVGHCDPGWQGDSCSKECSLPTFGNNCGDICNCIDGTQCNHVTGRCDKGQCDPGWQGDSCSQECVSPTFGSQCSKECHCINGTHCGHVSGHCDLKQCDPGWYGQSCDQESVPKQSESVYIPVVVGWSLGGVTLILIVVTIIVLRNKKKAGYLKIPTHGEEVTADSQRCTVATINNKGSAFMNGSDEIPDVPNYFT